MTESFATRLVLSTTSNFLFYSSIMLFIYATRMHLKSMGQGFIYRIQKTSKIDTVTQQTLNTSLLAGGLVFFLMLLNGRSVFLCLLITSAVVFFLPSFLTKFHRARYLKAFENILPESLTTVSSSLRAGLTLRDSLVVASRNCPQPFAGEVSFALKEYRLGIPIEVALDNIRQRAKTENVNIAFGAMIIASQLGGNLAQILMQISDTIRERQRVEGKLQALTAQGRTQAFLLCVAPVALAIVMYFIDRSKMEILFYTPVGKAMLAVAVVLEVIGIFVTKKIMKLRI